MKYVLLVLAFFAIGLVANTILWGFVLDADSDAAFIVSMFLGSIWMAFSMNLARVIVDD